MDRSPAPRRNRAASPERAAAVGPDRSPRPSARLLGRARSRAALRPAPFVRSAVAVAGEPWLWPTAVRQVVRLTVPGWWRRPPFLPLPDRDYLGFRLQTMYGDSARAPEAADVLTWLRWCRQFDQLTRTGEGR